jgi:malate dehydrogenase (oxaloacetate-decarboxylating)
MGTTAIAKGSSRQFLLRLLARSGRPFLLTSSHYLNDQRRGDVTAVTLCCDLVKTRLAGRKPCFLQPGSSTPGQRSDEEHLMSDHEELRKKADEPSETALRLHPLYRGKVQMLPKCPIRDFSDFAIWYTPGVAASSRAIERDPELVYKHTNRGNLVAIVTDGSRVLGLGNIRPEAALPVIEGKALLFKYLGGVDAIPICLGTSDPDELVQAVKWLQPSFGGVNLEDIAQPKCFEVLDRLQASLDILVWHDDQQGTAMVLLAGLLNALKVVGKALDRVRIGMIGAGAANIATYRLLRASGVPPAAVIMCDTQGTLHKGRSDIERQAAFKAKWSICTETNPDGVVGGISETLRGADVCIAFSRPGPGVIPSEAVKGMARDAIVFACAKPIPLLRSGPGTPRRPERGLWPPAAATFPIR